MFSYHGGAHGKQSWMLTPIMFIHPKARAKVGVVPGGPKMNIKPEQTKGAPKCVMPYGSQARMSKNVLLCAERMLLKLAPYRMFSSAGRTRTQIGGRYSPEMN